MPLRVPRDAEAQPEAEGALEKEGLPEGLREGRAEAEGMDTEGALEAVSEPLPPVTVPVGEGSAVGMVVTTAEADTVMVGEATSDAEAAAESDTERDPEGEPLTRALPEGDFEAAPVAVAVRPAVREKRMDGVPHGDGPPEKEPLSLASAVGVMVGEESVERLPEGVALRLPAAALGVDDAHAEALREEDSHAVEDGEPRGESVPGAGEPVAGAEGVAVSVARCAEALTLREGGTEAVGEAERLGLPDADGV